MSAMTGALTESDLTTREARNKLEPKTKPYWHQVDYDCHLGYRKRDRKSQWVIRLSKGFGTGNYLQETIGITDDAVEGSGFTFAKALAYALDLLVKFRNGTFSPGKSGRPKLRRRKQPNRLVQVKPSAVKLPTKALSKDAILQAVVEMGLIKPGDFE